MSRQGGYYFAPYLSDMARIEIRNDAHLLRKDVRELVSFIKRVRSAGHSVHWGRRATQYGTWYYELYSSQGQEITHWAAEPVIYCLSTAEAICIELTSHFPSPWWIDSFGPSAPLQLPISAQTTSSLAATAYHTPSENLITFVDAPTENSPLEPLQSTVISKAAPVRKSKKKNASTRQSLPRAAKATEAELESPVVSPIGIEEVEAAVTLASLHSVSLSDLTAPTLPTMSSALDSVTLASIMRDIQAESQNSQRHRDDVE